MKASALALMSVMSLSLGVAPAHAFTRKQSAEPAPAPTASPAGPGDAPDPREVGGADSVWIQRPDGSKSCEPESGQSIETAGTELVAAGVHILEKSKANDGKMHAQMCGIDSGKTNSYRIKKSDLAKAMALGFSVAGR